jgi:hypothetical protein
MTTYTAANNHYRREIDAAFQASGTDVFGRPTDMPDGALMRPPSRNCLTVKDGPGDGFVVTYYEPMAPRCVIVGWFLDRDEAIEFAVTTTGEVLTKAIERGIPLQSGE